MNSRLPGRTSYVRGDGSMRASVHKKHLADS